MHFLSSSVGSLTLGERRQTQIAQDAAAPRQETDLPAVFAAAKTCVLRTLDEGLVHNVRRGAQKLHLLAVENADRDDMSQGMTMLAGQGGRVLSALARAA